MFVPIENRPLPEVPDLEFSGITLSGITAWLREQPAWRSYDYTDPSNCAAAMYKASLGYTGEDVVVRFPHQFSKYILMGWLWQIVAPEPHTLGAAYERALRQQQLLLLGERA